ncbi:MAG: hypothetical protein KBT04_06355, partial [Bacteroidales bacterium]|nr:hypothetical protein [Candidatus Colimorpha onthohippi]
MVVFGIGINDASGPNFDTAIFRSRYLRLIDSVRAVNPDCAFVFITNNDSYKAVRGRRRRKRYVVNTNGAEARKVFYQLANETQGAVWDQFEIMGGLGSMEQWCKARLAQRDHVHFTIGGYQILGTMLGDAIIEAANCPISNYNIKHSRPNKTKEGNACYTTTPTATTTHPVRHKEPKAPFVRY